MIDLYFECTRTDEKCPYNNNNNDNNDVGCPPWCAYYGTCENCYYEKDCPYEEKCILIDN